MLGSPSAQQFAKIMGRSRQRSQESGHNKTDPNKTSRASTAAGNTLGRVSSLASREGSIRVIKKASNAMSGLSTPEGSGFRTTSRVTGDDKVLVETPNPKEGGGLESKVARLEWIMSDIQMQMRGLNRGQQANLEALLKGRTFTGDNVEISETPVEDLYHDYEDLPVDEQFKHMQKMRADTQVYFPVATEIWANNWNDYPVEDPLEYTHSRYTPVVTTDCREFNFDGYTLRVTEMGRKISMLVCITLYNEGQEELDRSLLGVCENLEYFIGKSKDFKHKILDWRDILVCLVQDGVEKASPSVLAASTVHGYYSPEVLQLKACGEPVTMHMFEYTARYEKFAGRDQYPPLQIMFLAKQNNKGKLDSHCWYFDAVAYTLEPDYCVLIDAEAFKRKKYMAYCTKLELNGGGGTSHMKGSSCEIDKAPLWIQSGTYPRPSALPELFMHFERDPGCGAATGELTVERPFRNFLTAVQFCEWKTAHLLNKPIESLCGYLTVLPGAFSAFRWKAVEGDPLRAYFMGLYAQADLNAFESNMFLAEDRILCLEIVAKENCAYRLQYVKDSVAEADPQTTLVSLIKQRRRWLNGTFFALVYSLIKWGRIWKYSKHSFGRKVAFTLEGVYLFFLMVTGSWLGLGLYYTALDQVVKASFANNSFMAEVGRIIVLVYLFLILVQVIVNLHNKPEAVDKIHLGCALYFVLFMLLFTGLTLRLFIVDNELVDTTTKIGAVISMGGGLVISIFHGSFLSIAMSGLQYWLMQPVYMNILQIHAFCNTHDISWGTKNLDKNGQGQGSDYKHTFRKGHLNSAQQKKESKAFWDARLKEAERKLNPQAVAEFNKKKEQKFKAFATYLLIAWLTTNVVLARVIETLAGMTWTVCDESGRDKYIEDVKRTLQGDDDNYLKLARIVEASGELIEKGEDAFPFGGIPDWPNDDMFLMWGVAQSRARQLENITVALVTTEVTKEIDRMLPPWDQWVGYISGLNSTDISQDIDDLRLPPSLNQTNITEISCKVYEGRTVYLRYLFIALACITVVQVVTSFMYILEYRIWKAWWVIKDHRERRRRKRLVLEEDIHSGDDSGAGGNAKAGLLQDQRLKIKVNSSSDDITFDEGPNRGAIRSHSATPHQRNNDNTSTSEVGFILSPPRTTIEGTPKSDMSMHPSGKPPRSPGPSLSSTQVLQPSAMSAITPTKSVESSHLSVTETRFYNEAQRVPVEPQSTRTKSVEEQNV